MGVDTHVSRGTRERFAFPVRNVLLGLGVAVLLRHAEVDNVDDVGALRAGPANEEVVWLDIPVDQVLLVDGLYAGQLGRVRGKYIARRGVTHHLLRYHDDGLDGEFAVAVVKQVLQAGTEQVNDEDVVKALLAKVVHIRNAGCDMVSAC